MNKILETLKGAGRLTGPEIDIPVSYELRVVQEHFRTSLDNPAATIAGVATIIASLEFPTRQPRTFTEERVTLHLDDGRKLGLRWKGYGLFHADGGFF